MGSTWLFSSSQHFANANPPRPSLEAGGRGGVWGREVKAEAQGEGHAGRQDLAGEASAGCWADERQDEGRPPSYAVVLAKKHEQGTSGSVSKRQIEIRGLKGLVRGRKSQRFFLAKVSKQ